MAKKKETTKAKCSNPRCKRVGSIDTFNINKANKHICKDGCKSHRK